MTLTVPPVAGRPQADAQQRLKDAGFNNTVIQSEFSDTVASGNAIGTNPASGATANRNTTITIIVSQGPNPPPTP
ncbi:MAG: PASTA domain-containing protein [Actinomycetia bacterium]|nr:PASTA domain-containing protein [Actinomycetes bacterium]